MDYSYIGSGRIYLRKIGANTGLIEVGNCSGLSLAITEDTVEQADFTQPGGGTFNEVKRIKAVEASIIQAELSPSNLARALYGSTSAVAGASVTGEAATVYPGALTPFVKLPASTPAPTVALPASTTRANSTAVALGDYLKPSVANGYLYKVTVAGNTGASAPVFPTTIGGTVSDGTATIKCVSADTLTEGTDYELRPGGLFVLEGRVVAGEVWTLAYTSVDTDVIQALTGAGAEYEILFDGLNEARTGKRTRLTGYRYKPGAAQKLDLIGTTYAAAEVTGKFLKDTTKTGAGVSTYFKVEIEA